MPGPYSDNLYSGDHQVSDDEQDALSPTDGYFRASSSDAASASQAPQDHVQHQSTSSQVPIVPNVLVEDPTLREQQVGAKAKEAEAERERLLNEDAHSQYPVYDTPVSSSQAHHHPSHTSPRLSSTPFTPSSAFTPTASSASYPTSPTHHHRRSVEEEAPLHSSVHQSHQPSPAPYNLGQHPGDAPPAYSPSPSSPPPSSPRSGDQQGYQTFPSTQTHTMGVPDETQSLLPRQPQSMGGPPEEPKNPLIARITGLWQSPALRRNLKTILGVLVILSVVGIIIGGFSMSGSSNHGRNNPGLIHDGPIKSPDPSRGKKPDGDLQWSRPGDCRDTPYHFTKRLAGVDLGANKAVTIIQTVEERDNGNHGLSPRVSGEVIVRPLVDANSDSEGTISLEVVSNDESVGARLEYNQRDQVFKVITPRDYDRSKFSTAPCIQIRITVWLPEESYLRALKINAVHLDVEIRDGLRIGLSEVASISTISGSISTSVATYSDERDVAPYALQSREIIIKTISGSVKGWFPLYDLLKISTTSGSITADIGPKPANSKSSKQAKTEIDTISGTVRLKEPITQALESSDPEKRIPRRDYAVNVETVSGNVDADLAISSSAKFVSKSGRLSLRLLPVLGSGIDPSLFTETTSGNVEVTLLEPLGLDQAAIGGVDSRMVSASRTVGLSNLQSNHESISGRLVLRYPSSWEGKLEAGSMSGRQNIRGQGLEVWGKDGWVNKTTKGQKGNGQSFLKIESMSGNQDVLIGEE